MEGIGDMAIQMVRRYMIAMPIIIRSVGDARPGEDD